MTKGVKQIVWYAKKQNNPIKIIRISSQIIRYCCFIGEKAQTEMILWYMWASIITLSLERIYFLKLDKKPLDMLLSELKGCFGQQSFKSSQLLKKIVSLVLIKGLPHIWKKSRELKNESILWVHDHRNYVCKNEQKTVTADLFRNRRFGIKFSIVEQM